MKLKSLFLLIISLATASSLVDIRSASAQQTSTPVRRCTGPYCSVYPSGGSHRGGTWMPGDWGRWIPGDRGRQVDDLMSQGKFDDAKVVVTQFLKEAEGAQDLGGQAAAHQALADIDTRIGELDSASSHLRDAETLYQRTENSQGSNEVQLQLQQLRLQQLQPQQLQPQQ